MYEKVVTQQFDEKLMSMLNLETLVPELSKLGTVVIRDNTITVSRLTDLTDDPLDDEVVQVIRLALSK